MLLDPLLGFAAACSVLVTFCMRSMLALRMIALLSNVLFIIYAYRLGLIPILTLHIILVPINATVLWREIINPAACRASSR